MIEFPTILGFWTWISDHWAILAIAVTCGSLLIAALWLLGYYVKICLNIFVDTPPPMSHKPRDFQQQEGEIVRFRSFDGTSLRGMLLPRAEDAEYKGTIVFCHEYGSDMYSCARYTCPLIESGYDIFTFDFRAHGESGDIDYKPVQWPSDKELGDALGACAYVQAQLAEEGKSQDIGLFGISRGAGSGLLAAASDSKIKAIVCDGAFSTDTTLIALMKRWASIFEAIKVINTNYPEVFWKLLLWLLMRFAQPKLGRRFPSVRKALKEMAPRPIFFIHGQRDSYIQVAQTELLHEAAPEPKYMWIVEKAKHNQAAIIAPEAYAARTVAFFDKYLGGDDIPESSISTNPGDAKTP